MLYELRAIFRFKIDCNGQPIHVSKADYPRREYVHEDALSSVP